MNIKDKVKIGGIFLALSCSIAFSGCSAEKEEKIAEKTSEITKEDSQTTVTEKPEKEPTEKPVETLKEKLTEKPTEEPTEVPEKSADNQKEKEISEEKEEAVPQSPDQEIHKEEEIEVQNPEDSQSEPEISGVGNIGGKEILKCLKEYGFSEEEGLQAPDGSVLWSQQNDNYSCDLQTDSEGKIYNAVFTAYTKEDSGFFDACAGIFSEEAAQWVKENKASDGSAEIENLSISISEGPMGKSLQICSLDYKDMLVGPQ